MGGIDRSDFLELQVTHTQMFHYLESIGGWHGWVWGSWSFPQSAPLTSL